MLCWRIAWPSIVVGASDGIPTDAFAKLLLLRLLFANGYAHSTCMRFSHVLLLMAHMSIISHIAAQGAKSSLLSLMRSVEELLILQLSHHACPFSGLRCSY